VHHANHFYGHAHILARYAGVDAKYPPRILGYLQHGWNILDGFAVGTNLLPGLTKFVWSDGPRRRGWSMGRRDYMVVGAPWNYLLVLEPGPVLERREGTIWYPFHGWEGQQILGDHNRLIAQIRDSETGPVTVCLYFNEFRNPQLLRLYKDAGFRVISHGVRGRSYKGTDPRFLYKQLTELRRHRRVASNRLGSAIFYGISVGCEPAVYGDPMILQAEDPAFGGMARMRRLWPELHGQEIDIKTAQEMTRVELGQDYLATPAEVREIFGWAKVAKAGAR
jgi:hypothetical protein